MSRKELIRKYNQLLRKVANDDYYKVDLTNRVNCYICQCGHITKTKDIDAGVTPFYHSCEKCKQLAKSSFYNDIAPDLQPTEEWYRPSLEKVLKMRNDFGLIDHILNGGLIYRKIKN